MRAYYNRGNAYAAKQEYDQAISDYNQAISLDRKTRPFITIAVMRMR